VSRNRDASRRARARGRVDWRHCCLGKWHRVDAFHWHRTFSLPVGVSCHWPTVLLSYVIAALSAAVALSVESPTETSSGTH
jgi:hypothetical protein